jgi:hypothetical protein
MEKNEFRAILENFEKQYKTKLAQKEGIKEYDLTEKITDVYKQTANKIIKKCQSEIEELNKYLENDFISDRDMKPIPGKVLEANEAYKKFYVCSYYSNSIINKLENILSFANILNADQLKLCKDDCVEKTKDQNTEMGKLCVKKCLDYSFNYSRKATHDLIDKVVDNLEKQVKNLL